MSLAQDRIKFTTYLVELVRFINSLPGIQVALDEGRIITPRKVKYLGAKYTAQDAVHIPTSFHYRGLAQDILLYRDGVYITDGNDPVWKVIDQFARTLDPWFGLGISFNDANHVSLGEHKE